MKITSGAQTGTDRAALDVAIELGLLCGGKCPKGRLAEDGTIPDHYPLTETATSDYRERTKLNIEESDGTLIFNMGLDLSGGTLFTMNHAIKSDKPVLVFDLSKPDSTEEVTAWIEENNIENLNVAGPRESKSPGIYDKTRDVLIEILRRYCNNEAK